MRDDQVRRYARHVLVPDIGGLGQTALLVACARLELRESVSPDAEPGAEIIAAQFLAAGGVGKLAIAGASDPQLEQIAARGADTAINAGALAEPLALDSQPRPRREGIEVVLQPTPTWWPSAAGDELALAYWRGSIAATRWMALVANG